MLNYEIESLDGIDENFRQLYSQNDNGKYVLQVDGVKSETELNGLMTALQKERESAKTANKKLKEYGGVSIDDINSLNDTVAELKAKDTSDVDALLKARLAPFEREKQKLIGERDSAETELNKLKETLTNSNRDSKVVNLANGKIKPEFMKDVKLRAKYELKYNDDVDDFVTSDGVNSNDWFAKQILETPSWELDSNGAGLKGGSKTNNVSGSNPWISNNLTEQCRISNANPTLAAKYKSQAGIN